MDDPTPDVTVVGNEYEDSGIVRIFKQPITARRLQIEHVVKQQSENWTAQQIIFSDIAACHLPAALPQHSVG